jgi:hypothetical protein
VKSKRNLVNPNHSEMVLAPLDLGGEEAVDEVLEEIKGLIGDMEDVEMEVKAGDLYVSPW